MSDWGWGGCFKIHVNCYFAPIGFKNPCKKTNNLGVRLSWFAIHSTARTITTLREYPCCSPNILSFCFYSWEKGNRGGGERKTEREIGGQRYGWKEKLQWRPSKVSSEDKLQSKDVDWMINYTWQWAPPLKWRVCVRVFVQVLSRISFFSSFSTAALLLLVCHKFTFNIKVSSLW